jgi:hypothetical protein
MMVPHQEIYRTGRENACTARLVLKGRHYTCLHGLGSVCAEVCAKRCREKHEVCFRHGSACALGDLAMGKDGGA